MEEKYLSLVNYDHGGKRLVVHNDEVNTFEDVIEALIDICNHTPDQAEQCTMIIHHKGKCSVKEGDEDILNDMRRKLVDIGIGATVE
jgi:ATP-dependent Clp protease adaptor protein ClpS